MGSARMDGARRVRFRSDRSGAWEGDKQWLGSGARTPSKTRTTRSKHRLGESAHSTRSGAGHGPALRHGRSAPAPCELGCTGGETTPNQGQGDPTPGDLLRLGSSPDHGFASSMRAGGRQRRTSATNARIPSWHRETEGEQTRSPGQSVRRLGRHSRAGSRHACMAMRSAHAPGERRK